DYEKQISIAKKVESIFRKTDGVVDVDTFIEEQSPGFRFVIDQGRASLLGVASKDVADTLQVALTPRSAGLFHRNDVNEDMNVLLEIPRADRSSIDRLLRLRVRSATGNLIPLAELGSVQPIRAEHNIYHKNLMPVVYLTADVSGKEESPV